MSRAFGKMLEQVKQLHVDLMGMTPVTRDMLGDCDFPGVYLFTEGGKNLYVGRTRRLRKRLLEHLRQSVKDAPFAFRLARKSTGRQKASYRQKGSRKELLADPVFAAAFARQKERIGRMSIRYVRVKDAPTQALLEIYTSTVLETTHNEFSTT
jgi:hypothetical protein